MVKAKSVMVNLYTVDVDRSVDFYGVLLGGTQTFRSPAEGPTEHVELRLGDVTIAVSGREVVVKEGLLIPTGGNPMELVVWCESVDETVDVLRNAGTPILVEPHSGHVSGHRRAYVADPDGNWIALVSEDLV
jgi:catechol 2,3-dioxygenase-like lactoylglutathione lyase family enzyme